MKKICVIQHTEAEYLGLMEDHFEGRNIRFVYHRPFASGGKIPADIEDYDGLLLLGGGPYGLVSGHLLPSFMPELRLTKAYLAAGLPVIGLELGALLLAVAAGGGADEGPLCFDVTEYRTTARGQDFFDWPTDLVGAAYLRDRLVLPKDAELLASCENGAPAAYACNNNSVGMIFHPGAKRGMIEDLIMEFEETPPDTAMTLDNLGDAQSEIAQNLSKMMPGLCRYAGLI